MDIRSFVTSQYTFSGCRLQDGMIVPSEWTVAVDIALLPTVDQKSSDIMLSKLAYFFDLCMDRVLMVDILDDKSMDVVNYSGNPLMILPGRPEDDLVSRVLMSKLSAITDGIYVVLQVTVSATDHTFTHACGEANLNLCSKTSEYIPADLTCMSEIPWWNRPDGLTTEITKKASESTPFEELYGENIDPFGEFDRQIDSIMAGTYDKDTESSTPAEIVKWTPKVV